jgi:hypothetical protein
MPPAYALCPSDEFVEDRISMTEKVRIASIAENKINNAFSSNREPSLHYVLSQAGLMIRAACEIDSHSVAVENQLTRTQEPGRGRRRTRPRSIGEEEAATQRNSFRQDQLKLRSIRQFTAT